MKKLVVLMLVVGMASLASAGLSFSNAANGGLWEVDVNGDGSSFTLEGLAGENAEGFIWVDYTSYTGQLKDAALGVNVNTFGTTILDTTTFVNLNGNNDAIGVVIPNDVSGDALDADGTMVTFDMVALAGADVGDTYQLNWLNGSYVEQFSVTVTVVPEPMTMVLLGLGGLFLRRKK